jgi:Arc/MetJ-type ribon-helix-helix transcriptional regulator
MATMNVSLRDELVEFVKCEVSDGGYTSSSYIRGCARRFACCSTTRIWKPKN